MASRPERPWSVLESYETFEGTHCVDVFVRTNETYGFEAFRRDPEDAGRWTSMNQFSSHEYPSSADAIAAAQEKIQWLAALLER